MYFIDGLSQASGLIQNEPTRQSGLLDCPQLFPGDSGLKGLFDIVAPILSTVPNILFVIDDLSVLEWMGISVKEMRRFIRAILHLVREVSLDHFLG
jgi:hypothetical protein